MTSCAVLTIKISALLYYARVGAYAAVAASLHSPNVCVTIDLKFKNARVSVSRNAGHVPPHEKCFVGSKVLPEIVQGCFQLWRTIRQQDQLALLRKPHHPPNVRGRAPRQERGVIAATRH
jgi:hypothetical protein